MDTLKETTVAETENQAEKNNERIAGEKSSKEGDPNKKPNKLKAFLQRKDIVISVDRYLIKALSAMAQGLFASLLAGVIIETLGGLMVDHISVSFISQIGAFLVQVGAFAKTMMGPAIGVAVAYGLGAPPLVLFASIITGAAGASFGGPAGAFFAAVIGAEFGKMVSKETKLDIMVTPMVTFIMGFIVAYFLCPYIQTFMIWLGDVIKWATVQQPLIMGIVVATIVGLALTAPISSAALCIMIGLDGLAGGAATAGCCAQMIGFAVMSFKANGWGGFFAQGLGTSMLQVPNIIKHPMILIPPTVAGMITGPLAITVWHMENLAVGSGMGTAGLVGSISTISAMGASGSVWLAVILLHFVLPAALTLLIAWPLRRAGLIKDEYMLLNV